MFIWATTPSTKFHHLLEMNIPQSISKVRLFGFRGVADMADYVHEYGNR